MTAATNLLDERFVERGGRRVRYLAGGAGAPVVLVHGLGGAASNWAELLPELVRGHRVLAVELPGHGGSERPARRADVGAYADAVAAVVEAEGAAPACVVGHSFGGQAALRLAHARPELVGALLLIAPAGIATRSPALRALVLASAVVRPGRAASPLRHRLAGRTWYRRALFRPWFVSDAAALSARATVGFLDGTRGRLDLRTAARAMTGDDPRADLGGVVCPTLVLWGARDPQLPLEDAFEYARRLRARLRVVADCGHLVIGERPRACLDALAALEEAAA